MVKQKSTAKITFSNFYFDGCGFGNDSIICRRIAQHPCVLCMVHNYTFGTYSTYKKYNRWFKLSFHSRRYTMYLICVFLVILYRASHSNTLLDTIRLPVYIHMRLGLEFIWTVLNQLPYQHDFNKL